MIDISQPTYGKLTIYCSSALNTSYIIIDFFNILCNEKCAQLILWWDME